VTRLKPVGDNEKPRLTITGQSGFLNRPVWEGPLVWPFPQKESKSLAFFLTEGLFCGITLP
jgi:hypothetical protein